MSRIEVSKIDVSRKCFSTDIRKIMEQFEEQEFQTKHLIKATMDMYPWRTLELVKRSVRWVIAEDIRRGILIAVRQGVEGDPTPGIYKRKEN